MSTQVKLRADGQPDMRKNNGGRREGAGAKPMYDEPAMFFSTWLRKSSVLRIKSEAQRKKIPIAKLINEWAQTLPPSPQELTRDMNKEKEVARELK